MAVKINHVTNTIELSGDGYMYVKDDQGVKTALGLSNTVTNLAYGQNTATV